MSEVEKLAINLFEIDLRIRFGYVPHEWSERVNQAHFRKRAELLIQDGWTQRD